MSDLNHEFHVWKSETSESICEVNLGSLQKGDEIIKANDFSTLGGTNEWYNQLCGLAPGEALIIVKGDSGEWDG